MDTYETMGELFRETQQHLLELTLWERLIKAFLKMLIELTTILNIDIDETMRKLLQNNQASRQLMAVLNALNEFDENDQNKDKTAIWLAKAS